MSATSLIPTTYDRTAAEDLLHVLLPLAVILDADHWRVFLAVCAEDGISLQKLGRITRSSQSEVIRATSVLESWPSDDTTGELLECRIDEDVASYRRSSHLTPAGIHIREKLRNAFGMEGYAEQALSLHQFLQQELVQRWQQT
jgi:hypothetical protein